MAQESVGLFFWGGCCGQGQLEVRAPVSFVLLCFSQLQLHAFVPSVTDASTYGLRAIVRTSEEMQRAACREDCASWT